MCFILISKWWHPNGNFWNIPIEQLHKSLEIWGAEIWNDLHIGVSVTSRIQNSAGKRDFLATSSATISLFLYFFFLPVFLDFTVDFYTFKISISHFCLISSVQWNYYHKWDTTYGCNSYDQYICSVSIDKWIQ